MAAFFEPLIRVVPLALPVYSEYPLYPKTGELFYYEPDAAVRFWDGAAYVDFATGAVATTALTRSTTSAAANEVILSASGGGRAMKLWDLGNGIVKITTGGIGAVAVADSDYSTPAGVAAAIDDIFAYSALTADTTLTVTAYIHHVKITAATVMLNITLPTPVGNDRIEYRLTVASDSAKDVKIIGTINGLAEIILSAGDSMTVVSTGADWIIE
jgi:hypothetical protein